MPSVISIAKHVKPQAQSKIRCYCTFNHMEMPKQPTSPDEMIGRSTRSYSSPNLAQTTLLPTGSTAPSSNTSASTSSNNSTESCDAHSTTYICATHYFENAADDSLVIRNITDVPPVEVFSTSSVLHYCKRKILVPYQRFLSLLGWRAIVAIDDAGICTRIAVKVYTIFVVLFTLLGYVLQYASCFRRDIVDGYKTLTIETELYVETTVMCKGTAVGLYFIPDFLHMSAYIYTFYLLRLCESEQLQILMERVFLQAFYSRSNYITQPKLVQTLRIFLGLSLSWIALSTVVQVLHVVSEFPVFTWLQPSNGEAFLIALLVLSLTWNDVIHATIIVSYSIQCQLLNSFIRGLCERVREKSITLQEAIKEIGESAKMLKHLNEEFSISVALMMLQSGVMSTSCLIWVFTTNNFASKNLMTLVTNFLCLTMWTLIFFFPLVQAARLSAACHCLKKLGQFLLTRPFGYLEMSEQQLDSFLLYTSSLDMQAKLFRVPVRPAFLFGLGAASCFLFLLLAQLEVIKIGI